MQRAYAALYCHVCPVWLYRIPIHIYIYIPTISHKGKDFWEKAHKMCILIFCTTFVRNISHSDKNSTRYYHKRTQVFMLFLSYFKKRRSFSTDFFENSSNIKFHENSSSGSRVAPCGRKDRPTDMARLTVAFRNFANAPRNNRRPKHQRKERRKFGAFKSRKQNLNTGFNAFLQGRR